MLVAPCRDQVPDESVQRHALLPPFATHPAAALYRETSVEQLHGGGQGQWSSATPAGARSNAREARRRSELLGGNARIQIHLEKTQIWNQGGVEPAGWEALTADARMSDPPSEIVWRGDQSLPLEDQGLLVLGTLLGSPQFVKKVSYGEDSPHS